MALNFFHEAWSYIGIATFVVILRFCLKVNQGGWRGLTLDDLLMVFALLFYAAGTSAAHLITAWRCLANNNMTPEYRASLDPNSEEWAIRVKGSKVNIVGWSTYLTMFWLLKSCWAVYYSRMITDIHKMAIRLKIAWGLIGTTFIACICVIVFQCWPFHRNWQINPNPGNSCQPAYSFLQVYFLMACNLITDVYLMAIPIPIIWKARLDVKRKVSLLVLFSLGWVVIIFGIVRCRLLVSTGEYEVSQAGQWSVRESFLAMLVSNAPVVVPLLVRLFQTKLGPVSSRLRPSKAASYQLRSPGISASYADPKDRKQKKFRHPLSLPTRRGSDEIITQDQQEMGMGGVKTDVKGETIYESSFEVDELTGQCKHKARVADSSRASHSQEDHEDIMVTREWEVTIKER